jgi:hypothetical protein
MTTKTKPAKPAPAAATVNAATVNAEISEAHALSFADAAAKNVERLEFLRMVDVSSMGQTELSAHVAEVKANENRAKRNLLFAGLLKDERFAQAWQALDLTPKAAQGLQIYAQDKLVATVRAIAANVPLSAQHAGPHGNNMTQRLVAVLVKDGACTINDAPRRMHDLFPDKGFGTYSAQASSSRQVLQACGMLANDPIRKAFSLNERGAEYLAIIGA